MSAMQRSKGKAGEREAAELVRELTGWDVRRRVRQYAGDSDLQGVPGWAVEVKRHRAAQAGEVAREALSHLPAGIDRARSLQ